MPVLRVLSFKARLIIAVVAVLLFALAAVLGVLILTIAGSTYAATPANALCGTSSLPSAGGGAQTNDEQIENARLIDAAAEALGLSGQASRVAIIAAYGESTLFNLDYGDGAINPDGSVADSLGLFQQQPSQGWGTREEVMDPTHAATSFLIGSGHDGRGGLVSVAGWPSMTPTQAIHAVQINANPNHYAQYYDAADQIIEAAGINVDRPGASTYGGQSTSSGGATATLGTCGPGGSNPVGVFGWAAPSNDPITSGSGMRVDPVTGAYTKMHWGIDYSGGCGTPIYAANGGVVTFVGQEPFGAMDVHVDSGDGYVTRYVHMERDGIFVTQGDEVAPGQQIAVTGSTGHSTGCHLHFEVLYNGQNIHPEDVLAQAGLPTS